jgi:hypothetical protein
VSRSGRAAERSAGAVCGGAGKTASDVGLAYGPYATALAAELVQPGQNDLLSHNVRVTVMDMTRGDQVPWTGDGIQRVAVVVSDRSLTVRPYAPYIWRDPQQFEPCKTARGARPRGDEPGLHIEDRARRGGSPARHAPYRAAYHAVPGRGGEADTRGAHACSGVSLGSTTTNRLAALEAKGFDAS